MPTPSTSPRGSPPARAGGVSFSPPAVSPETGGVPPEPSYDRLKRLFEALIRARHAALAHVRTHTVGQRCPECDQVITSDAAAQAAYEAAWHEHFD